MDKQYRITREEAIQILSTRDAHGVLCGYTSGVTEALDMAIEALKADKKAYEEALSTDIEWISITTSEPTTSNHVLVTYKWGEDDYETSELDYWVTKCAAEEGNKQCQMFIDHVIAWSFLPQPYKER